MKKPLWHCRITKPHSATRLRQPCDPKIFGRYTSNDDKTRAGNNATYRKVGRMTLPGHIRARAD